ncbi:MAG: carbohydrate ABC transporter permease [Lachnospiraceae bacterium]|nr:carbohydrate ABC transporter permease [Lachnospiraceae bacterium]
MTLITENNDVQTAFAPEEPVIVKRKKKSIAFKIVAYVVCIFLALLSIFPFWVMFINATRSSAEITGHPVSLIPSNHLAQNIEYITKYDDFKPLRGFFNSFVVSAGTTICAVYFSTMTAFALVAYEWKLKNAFFTFIMAILMIPAQLTGIGFYKFMYQIGMTGSFLPLILPSIAAAGTVFFMRQYMKPSLPMEILQSARIDGAGEIRIFHTIVLPLMKPAMATQAIFAFVNSWNQLFMPQMLLLSAKEKKTMPMMVSLLRGDIYKTEYGSIYVGLSMSVLPLFVIYFLLSKYIIAGVALGGVKG